MSGVGTMTGTEIRAEGCYTVPPLAIRRGDMKEITVMLGFELPRRADPKKVIRALRTAIPTSPKQEHFRNRLRELAGEAVKTQTNLVCY